MIVHKSSLSQPHMTTTKDNQLTTKQELFVYEYLKDSNATRAYKDVYWVSQKVAENGWPRLLGNARVKAKIDAAKKKIMTKAQIDAQWVVDQLVSVVKKCTQQEDIIITIPVKSKKWQRTSKEVLAKWPYDASWANGALDKLAKHTKLYGEQDINVNIDITTLTDEQLAKLVESKL